MEKNPTKIMQRQSVAQLNVIGQGPSSIWLKTAKRDEVTVTESGLQDMKF